MINTVATPEACTGVAVIGCGRWGMNHVRVWRDLGLLRVVCDTDPSRLSVVEADFPEVERSLALDAILRRSDIGAVVIATPATTHAAMTIQALRVGKDVLVEKPMALTASDGERMVNTARHLGRILMAGHVLEYHPAVERLRQLVEEGSLGTLRYLYANRLNLGRIRTEENVLWSFAPHDVAVLLRLLGMPHDVACLGGAVLGNGIADVTLTHFSFPAGVRAHILVSWLHPFKEHRFVVVGDRQMAVFDDTRKWSEKLLLYPHRFNGPGSPLVTPHQAEAVPVPLEEIEPLRAECEHFRRSVLTREPPLTDGESGLRVLRVLEWAERSMAQGGPPRLPS